MAQPAQAAVTIAAGVVLGLALVLLVAASNALSLPTRARWLLLLLVLVAAILAMLRRWERYD